MKSYGKSAWKLPIINRKDAPSGASQSENIAYLKLHIFCGWQEKLHRHTGIGTARSFDKAAAKIYRGFADNPAALLQRDISGAIFSCWEAPFVGSDKWGVFFEIEGEKDSLFFPPHPCYVEKDTPSQRLHYIQQC